ncbi:MAG: DUF1624 domain-containing protein [Rhodospirillaceae bacterium]|nr:DUF1624 domain-containing protein [Rhodospirillaceae bacterium]MBT7250531.1 DUF1624 domain-containing protein [Rhodospirillaceae bacterium]MBT7512148.1 DUF1624 domain-containing protein [Rhodospirillaceae bacterium]
MSDTATTSSPDTSPGAASAPATKKSGPRAISLDALKGLIMVVMALDHVRSFFMKYDGVKEIWYQPATYNPDFWSFTARYVSHLAAPGFFFLMGMGMVLFSKSREKIGWDQNQVFKSFLTRGMILIALQFIAEDSAWLIRSHRITHLLSTGVLSSLGGAMIVTAFMLRFKPMVVAAISVACLLASFAVVHSLNMEKADYGFLMTLVFAAGKTGLTKVNYPLVPWIGITGLGLLYRWYWLKDPLRAYKNTLWGGLILVALFCLMRAIDGPWNFRPQVDGSGFSFLQATKCPPSLSWLSLQMGINFLLIWLFWKGENVIERDGKVLLDYGRSPLFFYVMHLYLYAVMSLFVFNKHVTAASLAAFWWLVGLAILWPLCRWCGGFKRSKHPDSFWRFL